MNTLQELYTILPRTPGVLDGMLRGLPEEALHTNEGPDTWSPFDVVGHLLHGERTDWMARLHIILEHGTARPFDPYDRFAQLKDSVGIQTPELLDSFRVARENNMAELRSLNLQPSDLERQGMHPKLGVVSMRQLLSTWCAHDLTHIAQICRVLAKRYKSEIGPWLEYMRLVRE